MLTKFSVKYRAIAALLVGAGIGLSSAAQAEQGIKYFAGVDATRDDNLFRRDQGLDTTFDGKTGRGDTYFDLSAGVRAETLLGRQTIIANLAAINRNYSKFSGLNFTGFNGGAQWDWVLGNQFKGVLRASQTEGLTAFGDLGAGVPVRNKLTTRDAEFGARYWFHPEWHLLAGVGTMQARNSYSTRQIYNTDAHWAEGGVEYMTGSGNNIQFVGRSTNGNYATPDPNAFVAGTMARDDYKQTDVLVRVNYKLIDSLLSGQIGHTNRDAKNFSGNDFSGITGKLSFNWVLSPKTGILFAAGRDLMTYPDGTHSFAVTDYFGITPTWQMTPKIALQAVAEHRSRTFRPQADRTDNFNLYGLGVLWDPTRNLRVTARYTRDARDSNAIDYDYTSNMLSLGARLEF